MTRVSVIIPAYNAAATLGATLESVQAQSHAELEILVVDDGSRDGTPHLVQDHAASDPRIRLIAQGNAGVAAARNTGIAAATGEWLAPVDADDLWHPRKIELQLEAAETSTLRPALVYSWSRRIDEQGRVLTDLGAPRHRGNVFPQLLASNFIRNASSAMMRHDAVTAAGGFDSGLQEAGAQGAEDIKLYLALARRHGVEVAPYFLTGYRQVLGSMSQAPQRMRHSIDLVLADARSRDPDLPQVIFDLAHMNYDLYAASLALNAGDLSGFFHYVASGLRRAPGEAATLLACNALWRVWTALKGGQPGADFLSLPPDRPVPLPLADWFAEHQGKAACRAAARRRRWPWRTLQEDA